MSFGIPVRNGVALGLLSSTTLSTRRGSGGGGGGVTLMLDFLTGSLDGRIKFTRASSATYFNSAGVITSANNNVPRFDYSPTTLLPRGLLLEGARTNILLDSLIDGTILSTQSVTVTAQAYTLSFYGTGQIVLSGAASATITGTGAFPTRTTYTFTPSAGSLTATVTGTVQYAQIEAGDFASSFIPTAGAAATRAADSAVMRGASFSNWYTPNAGSIVLAAEPMFGTAVTPSALMLTGAAEYQTLYINATSRAIGYAVGGGLALDFLTQQYAFSNPATPVDITSSTAPQTTVYGQAVAYATNNFANSGNGTAPTLDTSGTPPATLTQMIFGPTDSVFNYGGWFGWLRTVTAYDTRLSDSTLANLSSAAAVYPASLAMNFLSGSYMVKATP